MSLTCEAGAAQLYQVAVLVKTFPVLQVLEGEKPVIDISPLPSNELLLIVLILVPLTNVSCFL